MCLLGKADGRRSTEGRHDAHGTDITVLAQDESLKDLIRLAINESDAVTAVSQDLIRETRELLDISRDIDLTYNFVDPRVYYPRDSKSRKDYADENEKILMHISNFRPVKRVADVLEIFAQVQEQVPAKLRLSGKGRSFRKSNAGSMSWDSAKVHFLGKQDEIAHVISMADVPLPSEKESFGLVALEAMACGVPTVGSTAGGIPELITHGETGYLAPIGDTYSMAQHVLEIVKDEALSERLRKACLHRSKTMFCNELIRGKYEEIYYRVLGREVSELKPVCG